MKIPLNVYPEQFWICLVPYERNFDEFLRVLRSSVLEGVSLIKIEGIYLMKLDIMPLRTLRSTSTSMTLSGFIF